MDKESEAQRGLDWKQSRPTEDEIKHMWFDLRIQTFEPEKVFLDYIEQISKSFPGVYQRELTCFEISIDPRFDWFGSRNRLSEINFLPNFLKHSHIVLSMRSKKY